MRLHLLWQCKGPLSPNTGDVSVELDTLSVDVLWTRIVAERRKAISTRVTEDDMDWGILVLFIVERVEIVRLLAELKSQLASLDTS